MQREIDVRERLVHRRFDHKPEAGELTDLTHFVHSEPCSLLCCENCGLILRDDGPCETTYVNDALDPVLLRHLYPRYLRAFEEKGRSYRGLLSPHAEVIEIGSHLGAFLQTAEEWGWRPTGFDIGKESSSFASAQGLRVKRKHIEDARIEARSADALFVWNCFEQLQDPASVLQAAHTFLKPHGLLVVRTPNIDFYDHSRVLRDLAYNNLLGFPYLAGYSPRVLAGLLHRFGFFPAVAFDSSLLTMPFPEMTPKLQREARRAYRPYLAPAPKPPELLSGPWIEILCRRESD